MRGAQEQRHIRSQRTCKAHAVGGRMLARGQVLFPPLAIRRQPVGSAHVATYQSGRAARTCRRACPSCQGQSGSAARRPRRGPGRSRPPTRCRLRSEHTRGRRGAKHVSNAEQGEFDAQRDARMARTGAHGHTVAMRAGAFTLLVLSLCWSHPPLPPPPRMCRVQAAVPVEFSCGRPPWQRAMHGVLATGAQRAASTMAV